MNPQEIADAIKETRAWDDSTEKSMRLDALYSMSRRRMGQTEFKPDVWLDNDDMEIPKRRDHFWHIFGFHYWLHYDDNNVFDGTRRICLICEDSGSSPMNRHYALYEPLGWVTRLNLDILLDFIAAHKKESI